MKPYFITHRLVWSGFYSAKMEQIRKMLAAQGIDCMVKTHQSTMQSGAFGQLASCQIAYDLFVSNEKFEQAKAILP